VTTTDPYVCVHGKRWVVPSLAEECTCESAQYQDAQRYTPAQSHAANNTAR